MISIKTIKREIAYDILRIIAIIFVLYNHNYTFSCSNDFSHISIQYIILSSLSIICKCGPPLFFMISGALLFQKEENFSYIFKHRIVRIVIAMIICTFLVMIRDKSSNFIYIFMNDLNWYFYQYLAFLFMIPFLRKVAHYCENNEEKLFLAFTITFYTLGGIFVFLNYNSEILNKLFLYNSNWGSHCWYVIFPFSGYFLLKMINKGTIKKFSLLSLVSILLFVIMCSIDIKKNGGNNLENLREHAIYPMSCLIFLLAFYYSKKLKNIKVSNIIFMISSTTFGIFILETHTNIGRYIYSIVDANMHMTGNIGMYSMSIVSIILELILCSIFIYIIRLIPYVKKVI